MNENHYPIAIIGSGPAGLFAVFECGQLGMKCHLIDALAETGGQCTALYPEKPLYDIPAYPKISGGDLIKQLEEQIAPYHPKKTLGARVMTMTGDVKEGFALTLSDGTIIHAAAVIISAGGGAFGPNKPPLENLAAYEGKSIFYHVEKKEIFKDKRVLIAGGGDSALDWALDLMTIAQRVSVVHRRSKFRGSPDSIAQLEAAHQKGALDIVTPYVLDGLLGVPEQGKLEEVILKTMEGKKKSIPCDAMLAFFGLRSDPGPIRDWGLGMENGTIKITAASCETSRAGIFAIGDIATYENKLKLILTGFAEGATAARSIYPLIFEGQSPRFVYSTTMGDPKSSSS